MKFDLSAAIRFVGHLLCLPYVRCTRRSKSSHYDSNFIKSFINILIVFIIVLSFVKKICRDTIKLLSNDAVEKFCKIVGGNGSFFTKLYRPFRDPEKDEGLSSFIKLNMRHSLPRIVETVLLHLGMTISLATLTGSGT